VGPGDIPSHPPANTCRPANNDASITSKVKVNVKSKGKGKFTLELATKAQRGKGVQLYSFFNLGARWWVVNGMRRSLYLRERDPVPAV
jgi:hypothetical protein